MSDMVENKIGDLIHRLLSQESNPGELHECPRCGGVLHVRFELYTRHRRPMVGVNLFCENCDLRLARDYSIGNSPKWLMR